MYIIHAYIIPQNINHFLLFLLKNDMYLSIISNVLRTKFNKSSNNNNNIMDNSFNIIINVLTPKPSERMQEVEQSYHFT